VLRGFAALLPTAGRAMAYVFAAVISGATRARCSLRSVSLRWWTV
jgi:hypothetical protein